MSVFAVTMGATEMHIVQTTRCGNVVEPMMLIYCVRRMALRRLNVVFLARWCECEHSATDKPHNIK